jgi:hypothetical protein
MKKSEPKIILNLSIENEELEEKVKIAIDKYTEQLVLKNLDDAIAKFVDKRIDALINGRSWYSDSKIQGVSFNEFVKQRTEQALIDAIDKNAKEILAKKLASLI